MDDKLGMVKVIEGEASESDVENEVDEIVGEDNDKMIRVTPPTASRPGPSSKAEFEVNPAKQRSAVTSSEVSRHLSDQNQSGGLLVYGEASESEEEENDEVLRVALQSTELQLRQPLRVETSPRVATSASVITSPTVQNQPPTPDQLLRLDSLLHKKLKETNDRLKSHIEGFKIKQLEGTTKDLRNISQQLSKSQAIIKEISNSLRMTTNDLFHMEDTLDIIASCTLIPYINITPAQNVRPPSTKPPTAQSPLLTT